MGIRWKVFMQCILLAALGRVLGCYSLRTASLPGRILLAEFMTAHTPLISPTVPTPSSSACHLAYAWPYTSGALSVAPPGRE